MTTTTPTRATNCVHQYDNDALRPAAPNAVLPWTLAIEHLAAGQLYWHTGLRVDGAPHVRPVFAVVVDGLLYSTSSATATKTRLLANDARCSLATSTDGLDLVYEAVASQITDRRILERVASAYHDKYHWPIVITGDAATAPFGAPAAGPPPYLIFGLEPVTVYGFGTDHRYAMSSTRWDFND
jgi:hypothetical protein